MTVLIALAVSLAAGLLATRVFKALDMDFPFVTAFLLAGMVIGPYGLGCLGDREGDLIRNVVLFSVMVYEVAGPSLTCAALEKIGEILPAPPHKRTHHRFGLS